MQGLQTWQVHSTLPGRGVSILEQREGAAGAKAHRQARKPENEG